MGTDITLGRQTRLLLVPQSFITLSIFRELGRRLVFNPSRALAFAIMLVIFLKNTNLENFTVIRLLLLFCLIPISFIVTFFTEFVVGLQAFFIKDKRDFNGILRAYNGIAGILSGILIPLDKLPFYNVLQFLPTSWLLHHPMQIYLGKYTTNEIIYVFLGGLAWCVALYFLAKLIFKLGLKRNESVGL